MSITGVQVARMDSDKQLPMGKSKPLIKPSHKGRLHKALGVPEGETIPQAKIDAALKSKDPHMRAMARFAKNFNH